MRIILLILTFFSVFCTYQCNANEHKFSDNLLASQKNNSSAFFEGDSLNYIFTPPQQLKIDFDNATADSYSLALIPKKNNYDNAEITIGVNIFSTKSEFKINNLIQQDTISIKEHYGENLIINKINDVFNFNGEKLIAFYFENKIEFIPNVITAYYFKNREVIIFEMSITSNYPRFKAEQYFTEVTEGFKVLPKGKI